MHYSSCTPVTPLLVLCIPFGKTSPVVSDILFVQPMSVGHVDAALVAVIPMQPDDEAGYSQIWKGRALIRGTEIVR